MDSLFKKILMVLLAVIAAIILFMAALWLPCFNKIQPVDFGVSFSKPFAESLGLDWRAAYLAVLDDLGARYLRIGSEWNQIEVSEGNYDFSALDWQMAEAEKRGAKVLLVLGNRQPRWPECHTPSWLKDTPYPEVQERLLDFIKIVVERYGDAPSLEMWQVENEPLFNLFGECPPADINFLRREIDLVRSLDARPILVTDSGELSTWRKTAHLGDYFGTTLYRVVYNPYFGYFHHFLAPSFYQLKARMVGLSKDRAMISELQAEPWVKEGSSIIATSLAEQKKLMSPEHIEKNIVFARRVGFTRAYLWGVEWWYWLREQGDDSIWQVVKKIWRP